MKDQSRIQIRTRKIAKSLVQEADRPLKSLKEVDAPVAAFQPYELVKPHKPVNTTERRSTRIAQKSLTQTKLFFKQDEKIKEDKANTLKRKSNSATDDKNKKLKTIPTVEKSNNIVDLLQKKECLETKVESQEIETPIVDTVELNVSNDTTKNEIESDVSNDIIEQKVESNVSLDTTEQKVESNISPDTTEQRVESNVSLDTTEQIIESITSNDVAEQQTDIQSETQIDSKVEKQEEHEVEDTPSPPSTHYPEPMTPPVHTTSHTSKFTPAPYKTYLNEADKQRIEYEKSTLEKLRKALDIILTDRTARNRPCLYHQIESALRNSTRRSVSLTHICQIMYITPTLYTFEPTEVRNYGGKVTEAYLLGIGQGWVIPFTGKELQLRSDLLTEKLNQYFINHPEPDATVPQIPLPRLNIIVDKKEWIQDAKLPPGVRALMKAHEEAKKAEVEKATPKPTPTGSVKDRMAALRARLAEKKALSKE